MTTIMVTHSIEEAAYLAQRVFVMAGKAPGGLAWHFDLPENARGRQQRSEASATLQQPGDVDDSRPSAAPGQTSGDVRASPRYAQRCGQLRAALCHPPDPAAPSSTQAPDRTAKPPRHSRSHDQNRRHAGSRIVGVLAAISGLLGLWSLASWRIAKPFLPPPWMAARALLSLAQSGALGKHGGASLGRVLLALGSAFVPAATLGLAAGRSPAIDTVVAPVLYVTHPLPKAAFLPIIILLLGLGEASKVTLVALIVFGQVAVAARDAARRVRQELLDSVRSLGAGPLRLIWLVVLPACLPDLLTALRVSLGTAVAVLFLSETFATQTGLGWLIVDAWSRLAYPEMFAGILALSGLGLVLSCAIDLAEWLLCPWRQSRH